MDDQETAGAKLLNRRKYKYARAQAKAGRHSVVPVDGACWEVAAKNGSSTVPMLHFRPPSMEAYQELVAEAERLGLTPNRAAKRRTFPPGGQ